MREFEKAIRADLDDKKQNALDAMFKDMTGVGDEKLTDEDDSVDDEE